MAAAAVAAVAAAWGRSCRTRPPSICRLQDQIMVSCLRAAALLPECLVLTPRPEPRAPGRWSCGRIPEPRRRGQRSS
ncbi:hypothetical protein EYF80_063851 [Liparis tanakae]|uniref:Uncharacterized protein n=1 Tax=Liparis tanakae TaxID=230148 RepID=A0A4Z2EBB6_9TELE|nr:hypothetical protein EYF80_063851 [Liparis tanakae]